ncbi:FtsB family cell division protein [Nocardioides solisilvae]|uniref:FtsB family cell division protein n=1 Tax=Nocardioides solisilvae TaxID=1542435 RepID=UPI000D7452D9|nr:septum formation initiator family protein [Nocardioides solisilvae]
MATRRTPRSTPGGSRRPGQRGPAPRGRAVVGPTRGATLRLGGQPAAAGGDGTPPRRRRFRLTGRAGVLLLVVAVLAVSYASSLRAYLDQRADIREMRESIEQRRASIAELEREKARWEDPAFVRAQARERFGYVMPGETGFQVLDADGKPLDEGPGLADPATVGDQTPTPWWSEAWDSVELAGHPPPPEPPPADKIDGVRRSKQAEKAREGTQ